MYSVQINELEHLQNDQMYSLLISNPNNNGLQQMKEKEVKF
jgi:hypothetical protein